ncbi:MAG TPA: proton-conducting transporter membrane subunit, partial [Chitinophagales bacterium]|nr:proton-conducting transporter membrane subunit [Chitinophagales bacterium]
GDPQAGMFHLTTHAFFKALLFLGAGSVIHGMSGDQDIRNMGGLKDKMRITFITFLIGTVAISGIPPFAGFFSKDQMLAEIFEHSKILFVLALFASLMTAFYMFRLLFLTFYGSFRGTAEQEHHIHESPATMTFPLIVLAILSTIGGFLGFPHGIGHALGIHHWIDGFLSSSVTVTENDVNLNRELMLIGITIVTILAVILLARNIFVTNKKVPVADGEPASLWREIVYHKFYVDEIYEAIIVKPMNKFASLLNEWIEKSGIDTVVNGIGSAVLSWSSMMRYTQNGNLGFYVIAMVLGVAVFLLLSVLI